MILVGLWRRVAHYAIGATLLVVGCSSGEQTVSGSVGSGGGSNAGGADPGNACPCGGPPCPWDGTGGGVSIPECALPWSSAFTGTVDGQPYNERLFNCYTLGGEIPGSQPPFSMTMQC